MWFSREGKENSEFKWRCLESRSTLGAPEKKEHQSPEQGEKIFSLSIIPWSSSPLRRAHLLLAGGHKVWTGPVSVSAALSLPHTREFLSFHTVLLILVTSFLAQPPRQVPLPAPPASSHCRAMSSQLILLPGADDPTQLRLFWDSLS